MLNLNLALNRQEPSGTDIRNPETKEKMLQRLKSERQKRYYKAKVQEAASLKERLIDSLSKDLKEVSIKRKTKNAG